MGNHSKPSYYRPLVVAGLATLAAVAVPGSAFAGGSTGVKPAAPSTEGCYDIAVCIDLDDLDLDVIDDVGN